MIPPNAEPDPEDGTGEQVKLTLSMYDYQRTWIEERADERDMNLSEYMRMMATAGERQLVAIESLADEDGRGEIEADIIERLPDDEADALDPDELLEGILSPIRDTVYTILKTNSQIEYSPQHEGYYLE
jgi:hypothetical protein